MVTDVTSLLGHSAIPVSSVLFNKKHFNSIDGHFLRISVGFQLLDPIGWEEYCTLLHYNSMTKWPPIGLKCFFF